MARNSSSRPSGTSPWQGSKTVGKGLRDGADTLDEQETEHCLSVVGTALHEGQDRPETQQNSCRVPSVRRGARSNDCASTNSEAPVLSWTFPSSGKRLMRSELSRTQTGQGNCKRCTQRRAGGFILVAICSRRVHLRSKLWRCRPVEAKTFRRRRAQPMAWRFAVL